MKRTFGAIAEAARHAYFWKMYLNIARRFRRPWTVAYLYTRGAGAAPHELTVRTPLGPRTVVLDSVDDLVTLIECFAKVDYPVQGTERLVVDFGANIGLSALYFLAHAPQARVHVYEPLERNVQRLRRNLKGLEDRVVVHQVAVSTVTGTARFGVEPSGRYGGIDVDLPEWLEVETVDASVELRRLARESGTIDLVKLDIEGMEAPVIRHLCSQGVLSAVRRVYAELPQDDVRLPGWRRTRQGWVTRFEAPWAVGAGD